MIPVCLVCCFLELFVGFMLVSVNQLVEEVKYSQMKVYNADVIRWVCSGGAETDHR